jgi:crotonobetainyl-CoA:carnitine CoA-transferase CaiB-like acyl-CoA transferase
VLLENFSPGTMAKLGFAPQEVCARHPRLIYCSISGFGQAGPNRNLPAYDLILQGMGGLMSITGPVGGPPTKVGVPIADLTAGMFASTAIMTALFHRERTGQGQYVDTSLLDGQLALLTFQGGRYFATGEAPTWQGNEHPSIAPYETFKTKDGYVNMAVGNENLWAKFCPAFGLEACLEDPRFLKNADRLQNRPALIAIIENAFGAYASAEVLATLQAAGVPCGPIYNLEQALTDPHVVDQGLVREVQHPTVGTVKYPGMPYRFSASQPGVDRPPPRLGEHTAEILAELGLTVAPVLG